MDDCNVLKTATDLFRDDVDDKPFRTRLIVLDGLLRERAPLPPDQTQCPIAQTPALGGLKSWFASWTAFCLAAVPLARERAPRMS